MNLFPFVAQHERTTITSCRRWALLQLDAAIAPCHLGPLLEFGARRASSLVLIQFQRLRTIARVKFTWWLLIAAGPLRRERESNVRKRPIVYWYQSSNELPPPPPLSRD